MPKFLIEATEVVRWEGYVEADTEEEAVEKYLRILQIEEKPDDLIEDLFKDSDRLEVHMVVEVPEGKE